MNIPRREKISKSVPNQLRYPREAKFPLEITETEITGSNNRRNLPRHIAQWETKSHRNRNGVHQLGYAPKVCQINTDQMQATTKLAWNILRYQLSDRQAQQKHLNNVRRNLERRLQVAKAKGNNQLVNILQEEFKQLETP